MINSIYRLVSPRIISVKYEDLSFDDKVIVRPEYMALCHADQRYYLGNRDKAVLRKKLPMALIHECSGRVVYDPDGEYKIGDRVALIPNVPAKDSQVVFGNYRSSSKFLSSGHDGFMREYVSIDRKQIVKIHESVPEQISAITEFVSVSCHALKRFNLVAHQRRTRIAVFGDGSLSYTTCCVLKHTMPDASIIVFGKDPSKLNLFSFAAERYFIDDIPKDMEFDHAFECVGNQGSSIAINDVIKYIRPQGSLMLMGVSELPVAVNTRNVLEKGMTLVGCSRSGRDDFLKATEIMADTDTQNRLSVITTLYGSVRSIKDIHSVFVADLNNPFKTVFKWEM
ncbi:MAG: alcohol dehydrogenase catalytic domain-containing protein [Lachnospiraceae bacterium]|nr:alcohol dehydrogenase catalytic domain-containing protein [Lachnospiraceae bacterium]